MADAPRKSRQSYSVELALQWAEASAALRGPDQGVTEADLVVGTLLAHPDSDGEMRRLLGHFGLTGLDLLPDDFPKITVEALRRAAATVGVIGLPARDPLVEEVLSIAESLSGGEVQLVHLLGAQLLGSTSFLQMLDRGLERSGLGATEIADAHREFLSVVDLRQVAGKQLGEWLEQRFPRSPANLAAFNSDRVDPTSDFVGIGVEADAFAYLLASRALVPPLAVGLFGNWGSGKSFLMAKIRHRVRQLSELAAATSSTTPLVWSNVAHIEFNAWEYVETNLWAALLDRIFEELTPEARLKLSERRRGEAAERTADQALLVQKAEGELATAQKSELDKAEAARVEERNLSRITQDAARIRDSLVAKEVEADSRAALAQTMASSGKEVLGPDLIDAVKDAARAAAATHTSPWMQSRYWTRDAIVFTVLAGVLVPLVGFVVETLLSSALTALLASLGTLLPLAAAALRWTASFATARQEDLARAQARVDEQLAASLDAARTKVTAADEAYSQARTALALAQQTAQDARDEHVELERQQLAQTAGNLLAGFVSGRHASGDYRKQLGLVSAVKKDLTDLAELTAEYNAGNPSDAHGPPNRIVLYIDDLDRCPPAKVVEVLEAVHLLLAFELFVVVVAVDTRWLTNALHDGLPTLRLDQQASGEQPSAVDYLEKIFQIPFWVEPLDDPARQRLLRGLLLPSVAASGGAAEEGEGNMLEVGAREQELVAAMLTEHGVWLDVDATQLSITVEELAFIESLAPLIGGTPRRVKRFVNVCQLLLAMAPPLSADGDQPTERMATCFMAALHQGSPQLAERLAGPKNPPAPGQAAGPTSTLRTALDSLGPDEFADERRGLDQWLAERQKAQPSPAILDTVAMSRFTQRFDVIRRLRFVQTVV